MTDYEAVYESVMRYARSDASDINSKEKLARYLRENDVKNRMSESLIDKLVETRKAERDLKVADERRGPTKQERVERFEKSRSELEREQDFARSQGFRTAGTVTTRKGETRSVIRTTDQRLIIYDQKTKRAREVVEKDGAFKLTGRFAKTPKIFER